MASDPGDLENRRQVENRLMASFIEMLSADAAVVVYTWTKEKKTQARLVSWGNLFATKGLVEWAYTETFDDMDEEEGETEDDEDV
jgi:hypothetical protein